ncbi:hypothetical protein BDV33DRAFT_210991 [Aspergillus novoparasiticus]|uniref:Uncharacterized protein n=1 Tax=Aspergillus novoparasiticus TaxID=986946 RepID=A0A5N6E559_9EURO|nr:hypothetical protein BDV33DRAFT_210991 [Aspergillus novoparasiticus]
MTRVTSSIARWWNRRRIITVEEEGTVDDSALLVSGKTLRSLGLVVTSFVWLHHHSKKRPFALKQDENVGYGTIRISRTARDNLGAAIGDIVSLSGKNPTKVDSITLYPTGDTKELAGHLISEYIYPYFSHSVRPVHLDDFITIRSGPSEVTFCIIDIDLWEYGLVTGDTQIMLVNCAHNEVDYGRLQDPLECARELQRDIDYINSKDHGSCVAKVSRSIQRLVDLLEAPPVYEESH